MAENQLVYKNEAYKIVGAAMNVHKELGGGFLEAVYQKALDLELGELKIPARREVLLSIEYKGRPLQKHYYADFVCYNKIILELKAVNELTSVHEAQILNYLKATGYKLGLLINFGSKSLQSKRLVY